MEKNGGMERMTRIKNKVVQWIWILLYGSLIMILTLIIALSITRPQHNLFPLQMAIGTGAGFILIVASFVMWDCLNLGKLIKSKWLYMVLIFLFGVLLYIVSCANRNSTSSLVDYDLVWNAAEKMSKGEILSEGEETYFKIYWNNIKPMLFLTVLFRGAAFFHISDPFYFVLIVSVAEVVCAVWAVGVLADTDEGGGKYRLPILIMFVVTLPIWANVQAFYTDSMSFGLGIIALALFKIALQSNSGLKIGLLLTTGGVLAGIGVAVKATVAIPMIAGFLVFCFCGQCRRYWKHMVVFLLLACVMHRTTTLWAENYEIWEKGQEAGEPMIDWIALGMKGNGSWAANENEEYVHYVNGLPTREEKVEYTKQYIWNNRSDFFNMSHLIEKVRFNFASGNLGAKDSAYIASREHNMIWEAFSPWGGYYWRVSQICFIYMFVIYMIYLVGALLTFFDLIKKREVSVVKMIADLALLGNILFLMIWEANNRQLYNQVPIVLLGAVLNARRIVIYLRQDCCFKISAAFRGQGKE